MTSLDTRALGRCRTCPGTIRSMAHGGICHACWLKTEEGREAAAAALGRRRGMTCDACVHWRPERCTLDVPEYRYQGQRYATVCSAFAAEPIPTPWQ